MRLTQNAIRMTNIETTQRVTELTVDENVENNSYSLWVDITATK